MVDGVGFLEQEILNEVQMLEPVVGRAGKRAFQAEETAIAKAS